MERVAEGLRQGRYEFEVGMDESGDLAEVSLVHRRQEWKTPVERALDAVHDLEKAIDRLIGR